MKILRLTVIATAAAVLAAAPAPAAQTKARAAKPAAQKTAKRPVRKVARKVPKRRAVEHAISAKALVQAGLVDLDAGRFDAAIAKFTTASQVKGDSATFFLLGYAHYQRGFRKGDPQTADRSDALETVSAYSMAMALDPDLKAVTQPYRLYHSLALAYEALKAYDKAIDAYRLAFADAPDNPMIPLYAARLRLLMGQPDKAASNLGLCLKKARKIGKEREVVAAIKDGPLFAALREAPQTQPLVVQADAEANLVAAVGARGDPTLRDALADRGPSLGSRMAAAPPQDPAVLDAIAAADEQFKIRRYRAAIDGYAEALRLEKAASTLSAIQLAVVYERMGTAYNKLGLSDEAVLALQRSLQQMPANANAHYQIALAHSVCGRFSDALKALRQAADMAPTAGERRRILLMAKTDSELAPVRDMRGFQDLVGRDEDAVASRR